MEEKSLKDILQETSSKLDLLVEQKKVKKWNLPWKTRFLGKKKKRQGYVVFMNIGLNKAVTFIKAPIEEGVAIVNGIPHVVHPEDILIWKNKIPIVIQPQFSERPYSARNNYEAVRQANEGSEGWKFIMNYILNTQIKEKKEMKMGPIIVGVLLVLGLGFYLIKSGAFK